MKSAATAAVLLVLLAAGCGEVGPPQAPINRTPLAATEVRAIQSGLNVVLSWKNPARYVDENDITDLAFIRILRNGMEIRRVEAAAPGQPQSVEIDVSNSIDADLTFTVQSGTTRDRFSPMSSEVSIRPVAVPGAPQNLEAVVDQDRILLTWDPPVVNGSLAQIYIVQRSDGPAVTVSMPRLEDESFEPLMKYAYTVTSARSNPQIPGQSASVSVVAKDERAPAPPSGLFVLPAPMGALLKWNRNIERDFKEVWIYRSDNPDQRILEPASLDQAQDPDYRPGLTYRLKAVDKSGNASEFSPAVEGP